jgi:hypothetical protein
VWSGVGKRIRRAGKVPPGKNAGISPRFAGSRFALLDDLMHSRLAALPPWQISDPRWQCAVTAAADPNAALAACRTERDAALVKI